MHFSISSFVLGVFTLLSIKIRPTDWVLWKCLTDHKSALKVISNLHMESEWYFRSAIHIGFDKDISSKRSKLGVVLFISGLELRVCEEISESPRGWLFPSFINKMATVPLEDKKQVIQTMYDFIRQVYLDDIEKVRQQLAAHEIFLSQFESL